MKKKIYIAGKVTGEDPAICEAKFAAAAREVEAAGYEAVNPMEVVNNPLAAWSDAMRLCIAAMMGCDGVLLLPCHVASTGAQLEKQLAGKVGLPFGNSITSLKLEPCHS